MMDKLSSPKVVKRILKENDLYFNKRLGQNFLIDENIIRKIVEIGEIKQNDLVLEIGPGIGTLTQVISEKAGKLISIEIDQKLIPVLEEFFLDNKNVKIINQDILKTDIKALIEKEESFDSIKVMANLPYYITTPIIMSFLESDLIIDKMVFLIQKEVGERLCAKPGTKAYGSLSIAAQFYADIRIEFLVPAHVFIPKPKVDSIVVAFKKRSEPKVNVLNKDFYFKIVKASFINRRKTLINSLINNTDLSKDQLIEALKACQIDLGVRGEALSPETFAMLANYLETYMKADLK